MIKNGNQLNFCTVTNKIAELHIAIAVSAM